MKLSVMSHGNTVQIQIEQHCPECAVKMVEALHEQIMDSAQLRIDFGESKELFVERMAPGVEPEVAAALRRKDRH